MNFLSFFLCYYNLFFACSAFKLVALGILTLRDPSGSPPPSSAGRAGVSLEEEDVCTGAGAGVAGVGGREVSSITTGKIPGGQF